MNLQRREEIREMCAEPARGGTQGAKQIFDLRDAINELFAHIDTLEQTAAERVIADGGKRLASKADFDKYYHPEEPSEFRAFEIGYELAVYRHAIPADRVISDEVGGDPASGLNRKPGDLSWFRQAGFQLELPDDIRANQGGAAT